MENNPTTKRRTNRVALLALPLAIVLLAAALFGGYAWGSSNNTDSNQPAMSTVGSLAARASATGHNDADVTFVQMMVPHHSQALDMAKLATTRASSQDVKTLAAQIEAAQQPEIDKMNGWLTAWGASASMSGMDHGSMSMGDGMMSQSDMDQLKNGSGTAFDKDFLTMMIEHHNGAISMAENELKNGSNADALALAASIQVTQQAQVTQMKALLKK